MSCAIVQNPQILPTPQTIQKPQNSPYSKYALGFAAGAVITGSLIINALTINSFMKETPSLFSTVFNSQTLTSVLKTTGTFVLGGMGGGLVSGTIGKCAALSFCPPKENSNIITFVYHVTPIITACGGAVLGGVGLTAARLLSV